MLHCGESQYAGAYPITSNSGALPTTNMGTVLQLDANDPRNDKAFADATIKLLQDPFELSLKQNEVHEKAKDRFSPDVILKQWEDRVFN